MNDEIKEILSYLKKKENTRRIKCITIEESKQLLDYITNLISENERLKDIVVEKDNQIKEMILQKTDYTAVNILEMKLEDYKSRCEKASEYVKEYTSSDDKCEFDGWANPTELLNILQNGSDSQ